MPIRCILYRTLLFPFAMGNHRFRASPARLPGPIGPRHSDDPPCSPLLFLFLWARLRTNASWRSCLSWSRPPTGHLPHPLLIGSKLPETGQNCPGGLMQCAHCASNYGLGGHLSSLSFGLAPQSPPLSLVESGPTPSSSSSRFGIALPVVSDSAIQWLLLFAGPPFCECSPIAGGVHRMRATTALAGRKPCFLSLSLLTHTHTHTHLHVHVQNSFAVSHPYSNDSLSDAFVQLTVYTLPEQSMSKTCCLMSQSVLIADCGQRARTIPHRR